jgi:hypothetical protein
MTNNIPMQTLSRHEWVLRCAAKLCELDAGVTPADATDLADTLHDLPRCAGLGPEEAAQRLFEDNLTPSQFGELAPLRKP